MRTERPLALPPCSLRKGEEAGGGEAQPRSVASLRGFQRRQRRPSQPRHRRRARVSGQPEPGRILATVPTTEGRLQARSSPCLLGGRWCRAPLISKNQTLSPQRPSPAQIHAPASQRGGLGAGAVRGQRTASGGGRQRVSSSDGRSRAITRALDGSARQETSSEEPAVGRGCCSRNRTRAAAGGDTGLGAHPGCTGGRAGGSFPGPASSLSYGGRPLRVWFVTLGRRSRPPGLWAWWESCPARSTPGVALIRGDPTPSRTRGGQGGGAA